MVDAYTSLASNNEMQEKVHVTKLISVANSLIADKDALFQLDEIEVILRKLQSENRLMYDETNREMQRGKQCLSSYCRIIVCLHTHTSITHK